MIKPTEQSEEEYKLEDNKEPTPTPEELDVPSFFKKIPLKEEEIKTLVEEVFEQFEAMKTERQELDLENRWKQCQAQYDGEMDETDSQFNLSMRTTKVKIDGIVRAEKKAFLESDPKFTVTTRPEYQKQGGDEVAEKQADFLDYELDEEIPIESPLEMVLYSSAIKFVGIMKLPWCYLREKKRREESYDGEPKLQGYDAKRNPIYKNPGLEDFMKAYPDAVQKYPRYVKKLAEGGKVDLIVNYNDMVYNNPKPALVENENFYVFDHVEGIEGLKKARVIVERTFYTWQELQQKERDEEWVNVDLMRYSKPFKKDEAQAIDGDYLTKDHNVLEVTYYFNMGEKDEVKIVCYLGETQKVYLHSIYYPYSSLDTVYIPFYQKKIKPGFWGEGKSIVWDLKDLDLAQSIMLNFMLEEAWQNNTVTPIVREGSRIETQILEKRWTHGVPLVVNKLENDVNKAVGFLQRPASHSAEMIGIMQYLIKQTDDISGHSSLMSGRESPTDPTAPATKTIALLKQSGINIEDYIRTLLPSFNEIAIVLLNLYYQMSKDGKQFRVRARESRVVGENPFKSLTRTEMITKTNIQSMAYAFALDKIQEKKENLALYTVIRPELQARGDAKGIYTLIRTMIKSWSPMWKNRVDEIWGSPEQFAQQQVGLVMAGIQTYLQQLNQQLEQGQQVAPDMNMLMQLVQQMQQQAMGDVNEQDKTAGGAGAGGAQ